ncbi:hypothetical protein DB44_AL00010 [Candidatus Protochlamydia amoebophila]|uniref:Transposase DDE domain-containing protein n=1 Tax=Candidatus Protochlamydia amoebophila TaxID=362787 RepID=A0A0C1K4R6_9BACT|nr:hypothetical protein DB44_AL00010 [Candidatus Protochlamydia amoebophila]
MKLFSRNIAWIRMRHYCLQIFFEGNYTRLKDFKQVLRSNRKQNLMKLTDKILLRKRAIIETVNDQLKNISQIE